MAKKKEEESVETPVKEVTAEGRLKSLLSSAMAKKILKDHGSLALARATEMRAAVVPRISTGIFPIDFALGGGYAKGYFHNIYGPKSSSKTTTIIRTLGEAQKVCADCCTGDFETKTCECKNFRETIAGFVNVEGTWDQDWAKKVGVDTNRLVLSSPDYGEQAVDIFEALLRSGEVDVLALDSIAFLVPMKEIENSTEQDLMGAQARLVGKFIRKALSAVAAMERDHGRRPTIFLTNQIRMKLGVMYGNPETQPGGNAPGFAASTEMKVWPKEYEIPNQKEGGSGLGKPTSVEFNFRVDKNKTGVPKIEGTYTMCLAEFENKRMGDIYDERDMVRLAEKCGALTGSGSSYTMFGEHYKGKVDLEQKLMYDPAFKKHVRSLLLPILAQVA